MSGIKNFIFSLVKIALFAGLVVVVVNLVIYFRSGGSEGLFAKKASNEELFMEETYTLDDYENNLKSQDSDIEGMTRFDKYEMGLDPSDGADSDMDGLTDKEEIEVYNTDPTLASTSGDLYTDGYKVEHNMVLTKYYDYKDDQDYTYNSCTEVILNASSASDFNATVDDYTGTGMYTLSGKESLRIYFVMFYGGQVSVDLSAIDSSLDADDVNVYLQNFYEGSADVAKFTSSGSVITISEELDYNTPYVIYLVKEKATLAKTFASSVVSTDVVVGTLDEDSDYEREKCYGVLYGFCWDLKIKYVETEDSSLGESTKDRLVSIANKIMGEAHTTISEDSITAASEDEVKKIIDRVTAIPSVTIPVLGTPIVGEAHETIDSLDSYGVYTYYVIDEYGDTTVETSRSWGKVVMNYDANTDFLPFTNFRTTLGTSGVCAGIAHLTSYLHNNGSLGSDVTGHFTCDGVKYTWDLTTDPENATLNDPGLSDYKDSSFVDSHKDDNKQLTKDLTDGEENFITLINYYWLKGNNSFEFMDYAKGANSKYSCANIEVTSYYDGTVLRNLIEELDKENFADVYFILDNGSAHAMNIIGYEKTSTSIGGKSTQGYVFYIYDCNYPSVIGTLTCELVTHKDGSERLLYRLEIPGASYGATSGASYNFGSLGYLNMMLVLDSEFNILNDEQTE